MKIVKVYKLEDVEEANPLHTFLKGRHVIGRGLLGCNDKRVSRNHAALEVTDDKVSLISLHVNPCFFISNKGKTIVTLPTNESTEIQDGDKFAFLASDYWFKIRILEKEEETINNNHKRPNSPESEITINNKKQKTSSDTSDLDESVILNEIETPIIEINDDDIAEAQDSDKDNADDTKIENETDNNKENVTSLNLADNAQVKAEPNTSQSDNNDDTSLQNASNVNEAKDAMTDGEKAKEEPVENNEEPRIKLEEISSGTSSVKKEESQKDTEASPKGQTDAEASSSSNNPRRERCWYGDNCYRRNTQHRTQFSHPGDPDYTADDQNDDRPDCPYGDSCYRRNLEHRRQYKHRARPAPKPNDPNDSQSQNKPKRTPKKSPKKPKATDDSKAQKPKRKNTQKKPQTADDDISDEDEYDLDDPFICDGSSDEYQISSDEDDDDDSEIDDSQVVEEDTEEIKRLKKEAKRFTKQK